MSVVSINSPHSSISFSGTLEPFSRRSTIVGTDSPSGEDLTNRTSVLSNVNTSPTNVNTSPREEILDIKINIPDEVADHSPGRDLNQVEMSNLAQQTISNISNRIIFTKDSLADIKKMPVDPKDKEKCDNGMSILEISVNHTERVIRAKVKEAFKQEKSCWSSLKTTACGICIIAAFVFGGIVQDKMKIF